MVGQPLQDSGLLYHRYFCSSVFLMNCKNDKTFCKKSGMYLKLLSIILSY